MLYLLDANVLITAHNTYYPIDRIPEFWDWLLHQSDNDLVKIPVEILEEITAGKKDGDALLAWITNKTNKRTLLLNEDADPQLLQQVICQGYANDLKDDEIEQLGRDPFLIAYAMADTDRCVVTTEVPKPSKQRQNKRIPDVCLSLAVQCVDPFAFNRILGFRTSWRSQA